MFSFACPESLSPLLLWVEKANDCTWFCRLCCLVAAFVSVSPSVSLVLGLHSADHGMGKMWWRWPPQMRKRVSWQRCGRGLRDVHTSGLLLNKQENMFGWVIFNLKLQLMSESLGVHPKWKQRKEKQIPTAKMIFTSPRNLLLGTKMVTFTSHLFTPWMRKETRLFSFYFRYPGQSFSCICLASVSKHINLN